MPFLTVKVRSRSGNVVLASLGATYAAAAAYLLGWTIIDAGAAFGAAEFKTALLLLASIVCGAWFVAVAARNAGIGRWLRRLPIRRQVEVRA
ncbi:MAG TPA: hypothetical protein VF111_12405 [Thermoanaerobaculia bacterium]